MYYWLFVRSLTTLDELQTLFVV